MNIRAAMLLLALIARTVVAAPLLQGVDHTPIVVSNLEQAQADFRAMGFAIKPGRPHSDGIRNAHIKFPDGTELELITATVATDALTSEYFSHQQLGDGPIYFGLIAPNQTSLASRLHSLGVPFQQTDAALTFPLGHPLHPLFFGTGERSATDLPEHFAHPNSALRLAGFWVRGNAEERSLLRALSVPFQHASPCGPLGAVDVATLPNRSQLFFGGAPGDGALVGARIEVRSVAAAAAALKKGEISVQSYPRCNSLWITPSVAHGVWLELIQTP
jgi:hypothetical protein